MIALGGSIASLAKSFRSDRAGGVVSSSPRGTVTQALSSSSTSSSSWKSTPEDDDASVYHDVSEGEMELEESWCGGTIIESLSSRDVRKNIEDSRAEAARLNGPARESRTHPLLQRNNVLNDAATIQSDALSFTPTMAELAMSSHHCPLTTRSAVPTPSTKATTISNRHYAAAPSEASAAESTLGITDLQPDRIACPFCDREKDLQWQLAREQEQSVDLKLSEYRTKFLLVATIVTCAVGIVSFFIGKLVSDIQAEKVMAQYLGQCNEMMSQREEEEMYWKLVTAALSAMINAAAGPAASFVFGGGKR